MDIATTDTLRPALETSKHMEFEPVRALKGDLSKACFELAMELPKLMLNCSKLTRMGIGRKLEQHIYQLLDDAVAVSNPRLTLHKKRQVLENMSTASDSVLVYLRLAVMSQDIDSKRYQRLSSQLVAIGKQIGGLCKYLERKTKQNSDASV